MVNAAAFVGYGGRPNCAQLGSSDIYVGRKCRVRVASLNQKHKVLP